MKYSLSAKFWNKILFTKCVLLFAINDLFTKLQLTCVRVNVWVCVSGYVNVYKREKLLSKMEAYTLWNKFLCY